MRRTTFTFALLAAALTVGVSWERAGAQSVPAPLRPPDLDQQTPAALSVKPLRGRSRIRWRLGFRSAAVNVGEGPLFIKGRRTSLRTPVLTAEQIVARADGTSQTYPSVGKLRYERFSDHQHWHLAGFARYELRRASGRLARPSLKRGFCLADSFRLRGIADPPEPVLDIGYDDTDCGKKKPLTTYVEEGISVGWGDDYDPHFEGQQIDVSRLRAGLYDLVNRVNPDRRLRETSYRNNDASLRLRLSWPLGFRSKPRIAVLRRCPASAQCALRGR